MGQSSIFEKALDSLEFGASYDNTVPRGLFTGMWRLLGLPPYPNMIFKARSSLFATAIVIAS